MIEPHSHFRGFNSSWLLSRSFHMLSCYLSLVSLLVKCDDETGKMMPNFATTLPTFFLVGRGAPSVALAPLIPPRRVLVVDVHRYAGVELRAALRTAAVPLENQNSSCRRRIIQALTDSAIVYSSSHALCHVL